MNIISSDAETNENYFLGIKSIELFPISKQLTLQYFLGFVNHLIKMSKEKSLKVNGEFLK